MRLPFHQYDKSDNEITGDKPFEFSEQELLWASLTVGAPSLSVALKNIRDSPAFALHKWFAIRSVVEIIGSGTPSGTQFTRISIKARRLFCRIGRV